MILYCTILNNSVTYYTILYHSVVSLIGCNIVLYIIVLINVVSYRDLNDTEFNSSTMHPISKHDSFDVMIKCIVLLWFFGEFRDGHVQGFIQKQCHNSDKNCGTSA